MKTCHEDKAKTLLLAVQKIVFATFVTKPLSLKSHKYVHDQAESCRPTIWFVLLDNAIVFTYCSLSTGLLK